MKTETLQKPKDKTWLQKLPELRTAADFNEATAGLQADLVAAEARIETLKAENDAALFGGKDNSAIQAELGDVTREISDITAALNGAVSRRDAAVVAEHKQRRQDLKDENERLGNQLAAVLKRRIANIQKTMTDWAEEDRIEQHILLNNLEIESSGVTNTEKFTEQKKVSKIRRENLNPTFVPEFCVPAGLRVVGQKWQRFWLLLMTSQRFDPPE